MSIWEGDVIGVPVCQACISMERQKHEVERDQRKLEVKESSVANALASIAVIEFVVSVIAGVVVGEEKGAAGWLVFFSGVIGGLILLGFSKVIEHSYESAQRLRRIEILLRKIIPEKNTRADAPAPVPATVPPPIGPSERAPAPLPKPRSYFFALDGKDSGPHSLEEMRQFRRSGTLTDETLVIRLGESEWHPVGMVAEIANLEDE